MKKLEDRILKKVYIIEARKTSWSFLSKSLLFLISGFTAFLFTQVLVELFTEERTFNVLEILNDDWEAVSHHLGDIIFVLFAETPKIILLVIVLAVFAASAVVLTFIKNFGKMRHKVNALLRYWKGRS